MQVERGEIYFVYLDPVFGRELGGYKSRPVVVLSINDINSKPLVVTVVPGTSTKGYSRPFRNVVVVPPTNTNGLKEETSFECHQLRAIDKGRLTVGPIGRLSPQHLTAIESAAKYSLGLLS